jgi:hypothetical protein
MPAQPFVCRCCRPGQTLAKSLLSRWYRRHFPKSSPRACVRAESYWKVKNCVRPPLGRPVVMWGMPRISSMMNSSLIVIGGQKTLHFGSRAGDGAPGSFGKGNGITFLYFAARFSRRKTSGVRCAHLILFGQALLKAINKLHGQKTSCSANLDSSDFVRPAIPGLPHRRIVGLTDSFTRKP